MSFHPSCHHGTSYSGSLLSTIPYSVSSGPGHAGGVHPARPTQPLRGQKGETGGTQTLRATPPVVLRTKHIPWSLGSEKDMFVSSFHDPEIQVSEEGPMQCSPTIRSSHPQDPSRWALPKRVAAHRANMTSYAPDRS